MATLFLKSGEAVEEAIEVLAVARRLVAECEAALADDDVTPDEARNILAIAREALKEARESVEASEKAHLRDKAIDVLRRGSDEFSDHHKVMLREVGLTPLPITRERVPDNVREFKRDNTPAAS